MPACLVELNKLIEKENLIVGKEAIQLSGMQDSLIEIITTQNLYFGSITTFMVSDPNNFPPFNSPGAPKPSHIHSKTSGLVGGYIPMDPIFTRLDAYRQPLGHHYHDKLDTQESVQVKWTLWEILKRCDNKGDLCIDWPTEASPIVRFKFKENKGPIGFNGGFQLNLSENRKTQSLDITDIRVVTRNFDDPEKFFNLIPSKIIEAFFENPKEIYYVPYKIFYSKEKNGIMQPLKVFAINGMPIIGDWDKDLEGLPLNIGILNLEMANKELNTFFTSNLEENHFIEQMKLIKATKNLFLNFLYKNFTFQNEFNELFLLGLNNNSKNLIKDIEQLFHKIAIKNSLLERAGNITPYEFLANMLTNHVHNCNNAQKGLSEYFNDPCQHGVATRSPFIVDKTIHGDSNGPRFHIIVTEDQQLNYSVQYIYTINEIQRVKLYLIKGILESNFIHVSDWLDMDKWSPIIEKQIELKQRNLIAAKTFDKYLLYLSSRHTISIPKSLPSHDKSLAKRAFTYIIQPDKRDENFMFNFNNRSSSFGEGSYEPHDNNHSSIKKSFL